MVRWGGDFATLPSLLSRLSGRRQAFQGSALVPFHILHGRVDLSDNPRADGSRRKDFKQILAQKMRITRAMLTTHKRLLKLVEGCRLERQPSFLCQKTKIISLKNGMSPNVSGICEVFVRTLFNRIIEKGENFGEAKK